MSALFTALYERAKGFHRAGQPMPLDLAAEFMRIGVNVEEVETAIEKECNHE